MHLVRWHRGPSPLQLSHTFFFVFLCRRFFPPHPDMFRLASLHPSSSTVGADYWSKVVDLLLNNLSSPSLDLSTNVPIPLLTFRFLSNLLKVRSLYKSTLFSSVERMSKICNLASDIFARTSNKNIKSSIVTFVHNASLVSHISGSPPPQTVSSTVSLLCSILSSASTPPLDQSNVATCLIGLGTLICIGGVKQATDTGHIASLVNNSANISSQQAQEVKGELLQALM